MYTQALVLDTCQSPFGKRMLLLFTPREGKICCSLSEKALCPSAPALIEIEIVEGQKGFYRAKNVEVEETFSKIRSSESLRKSYTHLAKIIQETLPLNTESQETWNLFSTILFCFHLFEDSSMPLLLIAFSLAVQQGIDLEWLEESRTLDDDTKKLLHDIPSMRVEELLETKCPELALKVLLEEISLGKKENAKGGT